MSTRPAKVGILAMEWYAPRTFVPQTALETQDDCAGKYVVGLGQDSMAFVDDREDIASVLMNACSALLASYGVSPGEVGRLEVGTETLVDKSKSAKTSLLALFAGNADLEGVTSVNACYGGTAALLNSVAWIESSAWDGRLAVVVCGDIAVYEPGAARPSGGCGAVAMLVGPDAPLALEAKRSTHAMDVWDFYKPKHSEYAAVDGKLSQACYLRSVDACWRALKAKSRCALADFGFCVFHAPYNKLVQKGFARLALGDAINEGDAAVDAAAWCVAGDARYEDSLTDKALDAQLRAAAKQTYAAKVAPGTALPKALGNLYTGSVFAGLLSLVDAKAEELVATNARVLLYSYGSGSVATMYTLEARAPAAGSRFSLGAMKRAAAVQERLAARTECSAAHFAAACALREQRYGSAPYAPCGASDPAAGAAVSPAPLAPGAFRLAAVDDLHRRTYARSE